MKAAIISVDGHVRAPRAVYRHYIEARHIEEYDRWVAYCEESGMGDRGSVQPELADECQWDLKQRFTDLESQGVVAEVVFPNGLAFQRRRFEDAGLNRDPELTRAANMAYNRWLADLCAEGAGRVCGQAIVLFDDVEQAVQDVYWAKEHGLGGVMMPGLNPGGTFFFDPALDPIWSAIEETGLPISQHGGAGSPEYGPPGYAAIMTLAYEQAFFAGRSLWQMIVGGVFDRFPGLTVVFVETEMHWIGPALQRFDLRVSQGDDWTAFARQIDRTRQFGRLPSGYWATNCYAGISPFYAPGLPVDELGSGYAAADGQFVIRAERAMFGVDFPHFESVYPRSPDQVTTLIRQPTVTDGDMKKLLYENAAEVYKFDLRRLQAEMDRIGFDLSAPASGGPQP